MTQVLSILALNVYEYNTIQPVRNHLSWVHCWNEMCCRWVGWLTSLMSYSCPFFYELCPEVTFASPPGAPLNLPTKGSSRWHRTSRLGQRSQSVSITLALPNTSSTANEAFFTSQDLDFLLVTETWHISGELSPFSELFNLTVIFSVPYR